MVGVVVVVDVVVMVVVEDVLISNCSIEVNISVKSVATDSSNFTSTSARMTCSVSLQRRFLDAIILSQKTKTWGLSGETKTREFS